MLHLIREVDIDAAINEEETEVTKYAGRYESDAYSDERLKNRLKVTMVERRIK